MLRVMMTRAGHGASAACLLRGFESRAHDGPDRPGAAAAIRRAAKALIDLGGCARAARAGLHARLHVTVGQDVAGTDDHGQLSLE